ncbi:MAG: Crp/Fnr family transcriptional regulator [Proteobacteria bacterium]|nr:Crp/Fnr family transcriptional regulator [Pseudomonadota bacterium]
MIKLKAIIETTPLFNSLPVTDIDALASIAVLKTFNKGEPIFSEGDLANGFYIVADGKVKIFKVSVEGKEHILHIFGPGNPFGEVPVFQGKAFPANAQALSKSTLIFLPRIAFVNLITENPSMALNMLGILSMRLREFTVQIENLSLKEVPGRLAAYLLFLSKEQKNGEIVTLKISKGQLASLLGTIPETLSRIFTKMSSMNLIEVDGKTIRLLDMDGLTDLSEQGKI